MNSSNFLRRIVYAVILLVLLTASAALAAWNLPYPQPAKYDFRTAYSTEMLTYLNIDDTYLQTNLTKGWTYYKANFIMANGLVNHRRKDPNGSSTIGTNEAVSEGQGYGMLLAVLNNDQATFNTILEAANQFLWNSNSYNWTWPNTSTGAATDADLDIGLALVFADELQKKGLWTPYNKNSVTYNSQALKVIGSISTRMTSNGYLLPGDNWNSDGINNLNPSYFAVAWLKVFNAYQTTYNFTAVIDKCYLVLRAKSAMYAKGQAPDWCKADGSPASQRSSQDFGNDAIRTPWRIAMDAIWFNDARAIEFCKNSKLTLTEYANVNKGQLLAQMSQYTAAGDNIITFAGSFSEVAMWASAILGSRDASYTKEALCPDVFGRIVGENLSFGNKTLGDDIFYYKQSLGLLGFATISGQFPNIYADMRDTTPAQAVTLSTALAANKATVALPGSVAFTATLSADAVWTLTITGRTSGQVDSYNGTSKNVSVNWTGSGWYTLETVDAVLSVANLDAATVASRLKASVQITAAPARPTVVPGSTLVLHDMENKTHINNWVGSWFAYTDKTKGGTSTTTPDSATLTATLIGAAYGNNSSYGAKATYNVIANTTLGYQYAGLGMTFAKNGVALNMSMFESITFDYKTEGSDAQKIVFQVATTNITDGAYGRVALDPSTSWLTKTVNFIQLLPPTNFGTGAAPDWTKATQIQFQWDAAGTGKIYIDNIKVKLKQGQVPGADIMALLSSPVHTISKGRSSAKLSAFQSISGLVVKSDYAAIASHGGTLSIEVYDLSGERRFSKDIVVDRFSDNHEILVANSQLAMAPGMYLVGLRIGGSHERGSWSMQRVTWR